MEESRNVERLVARLRHYVPTPSVTEVLIAGLNKRSKELIIEYLIQQKLKTSVEATVGEDTVLSVEVTTKKEEKDVFDNLLKYLQTVGIREVSISNEPFDERKPEIEASSSSDLTCRPSAESSSRDVVPGRKNDDSPEGRSSDEDDTSSEFELILARPSSPGSNKHARNTIATHTTSKNVITPLLTEDDAVSRHRRPSRFPGNDHIANISSDDTTRDFGDPSSTRTASTPVKSKLSLTWLRKWFNIFFRIGKWKRREHNTTRTTKIAEVYTPSTSDGRQGSSLYTKIEHDVYISQNYSHSAMTGNVMKKIQNDKYLRMNNDLQAHLDPDRKKLHLSLEAWTQTKPPRMGTETDSISRMSVRTKTDGVGGIANTTTELYSGMEVFRRRSSLGNRSSRAQTERTSRERPSSSSKSVQKALDHRRTQGNITQQLPTDYNAKRHFAPPIGYSPYESFNQRRHVFFRRLKIGQTSPKSKSAFFSTSERSQTTRSTSPTELDHGKESGGNVYLSEDSIIVTCPNESGCSRKTWHNNIGRRKPVRWKTTTGKMLRQMKEISNKMVGTDLFDVYGKRFRRKSVGWLKGEKCDKTTKMDKDVNCNILQYTPKRVKSPEKYRHGDMGEGRVQEKVVRLADWGPDYTASTSNFAETNNIAEGYEENRRSSKVCALLSGRKRRKQLKNQLKRHKMELHQMKLVLASVTQDLLASSESQLSTNRSTASKNLRNLTDFEIQ